MAIASGEIISASDILALLDLSSRTTFTTSPAGSGWYQTWGGMGIVHFATTSTIAAGSSSTIYTLPAEMRPDYPIPLAAATGSTITREANGVVNTDGTIVVRNNYSSADTVTGYAIYPLS